MKKALPIFLAILVFGLTVLGFLGFKSLGSYSCNDLACPLTQGVLAFSVFFNNHVLTLSTFVVILFFFLVSAYQAKKSGIFKNPDGKILETASHEEKISNLTFNKSTFWFILHQNSPSF
ncbi:hypothetical protein M1506_01790 [Patescibacteria group bacterium]|nr:hypothetical protein [Patescibacteria group bacterium]